MSDPRWHTPGVAARHYGVCIQTVRNWIKAHKLQARRTPSGRFQIPASEFARLPTHKTHNSNRQGLYIVKHF